MTIERGERNIIKTYPKKSRKISDRWSFEPDNEPQIIVIIAGDSIMRYFKNISG